MQYKWEVELQKLRQAGSQAALNPNDDIAFNFWDDNTTTTVETKVDSSTVYAKTDSVTMGTNNINPTVDSTEDGSIKSSKSNLQHINVGYDE